MKHRYDVIGVDSHGNNLWLMIIASDIVKAIEYSREQDVNPHEVRRCEQVSATTHEGIRGRCVLPAVEL